MTFHIIKSHSFCINMILNLLKTTILKHVAEIIKHNDINFTITYQRYAILNEEVFYFRRNFKESYICVYKS